MNNRTTRRALLAGALALPLAPRQILTAAALPALAGGTAPLVGEGEVLELSLHEDVLLCAREASDWSVTMFLTELADWPLNLLINGRDRWTLGDLVRDLRRLLAVLETGAPIVDTLHPEPAPCTVVNLVPHTAKVLGFEFWS